jgi:hypothetical protein
MEVSPTNRLKDFQVTSEWEQASGPNQSKEEEVIITRGMHQLELEATAVPLN